jgi:hypothetical protein
VKLEAWLGPAQNRSFVLHADSAAAGRHGGSQDSAFGRQDEPEGGHGR